MTCRIQHMFISLLLFFSPSLMPFPHLHLKHYLICSIDIFLPFGLFQPQFYPHTERSLPHASKRVFVCLIDFHFVLFSATGKHPPIKGEQKESRMRITVAVIVTFASQNFKQVLQQLLFLIEKFHAFFIFDILDNMSTINIVSCHKQPETADKATLHTV